MIKELLQSALHPSEINAMLRLKFGNEFDLTEHKEPLDELARMLPDHEFCYAALNKVSRSFAVVIQQLPLELRDPVCMFYLVLRGLDSIEDDMDFPTEKKMPLLRTFHQVNRIDGWKLEGVGDSADYRVLLANYHKVISVFKSLDYSYQHVIADICERMGNGMADYAEKKVVTLMDYDHYCHYVAGLVGIGLSGLFSASGLESDVLKDKLELSNSMGLLLQKTNISRDYYEDLSLGRSFWPKEIWGKYTDRLDEFEKDPTSPESLACINELVTDALQHACNCIEYLRLIRHPMVFRFCAIPQVMAMATLAKIYNNPDVFTSVVKIRKGLAAKLILYTNDMDAVLHTLERYTTEIQDKLVITDPNYTTTKKRLNRINEAIDDVRYNNSFGQKITPRIEEVVLF